MKRLGVAVLLGAVLGWVTLAEPAAVKLPPAEEEIQALRNAWAQVLAVFEGFVGEFKGAVETFNQNDQDLLGKYRALAVQLKDLEAKLLQLQEMWGQKIPTLEKGLADCFAQVSALRKGLEEAVAGYRAADADLEAKLTAMILGVRQALEEAMATCKAADAALEAKIAALATQVDQLSSRVGILESYDIGNLSRRVLGLEQAIQAVQIKIENNREKIAALEKTLGGFAADISALKESVLDLDVRVSDQEARIAAVEEAVGTNLQDLTARLDSIQMLAVLGLLAGIGAIVLVLLGMGG